MLNDQEFIKQSLEMDLFFLRISKEHAIFLEGSFTPKNMILMREADMFKDSMGRLLSRTVRLSRGIIRVDGGSECGKVTDLTMKAERATQHFTGIPIDTGITRAELALNTIGEPSNIPAAVREVEMLNSDILSSATALAGFKAKVLKDVLACKIFTHNYPDMVDHIYREIEFFIDLVIKVQKRESIDTADEFFEVERFWNGIMKEHAEYIRGMLDPNGGAFVQTADKFVRIFDGLIKRMGGAEMRTEEADEARISPVPSLTGQIIKDVTDFRNFKRQGTEGILACSIKSVILPLLADHVTREANYYLRLLKSLSSVR